MAENSLIVSGQDVENLILYKRELNGLQTTVKENRIAQNEFRDSLHKTRVIMLGHSDVVRSTAREYENLHRKLGEFDWEDLQGDIAGTTRELRMFNDELERTSRFSDKEITLTVLTKMEAEQHANLTPKPNYTLGGSTASYSINYSSPNSTFKASEYTSNYEITKLIPDSLTKIGTSLVSDVSGFLGDIGEGIPIIDALGAFEGTITAAVEHYVAMLNDFYGLVQEAQNAAFKRYEVYSGSKNGELYANYESAVMSNTVNGYRKGAQYGMLPGLAGAGIGYLTGQIEADELKLTDLNNSAKIDIESLISRAQSDREDRTNAGLAVQPGRELIDLEFNKHFDTKKSWNALKDGEASNPREVADLFKSAIQEKEFLSYLEKEDVKNPLQYGELAQLAINMQGQGISVDTMKDIIGGAGVVGSYYGLGSDSIMNLANSLAALSQKETLTKEDLEILTFYGINSQYLKEGVSGQSAVNMAIYGINKELKPEVDERAGTYAGLMSQWNGYNQIINNKAAQGVMDGAKGQLQKSVDFLSSGDNAAMVGEMYYYANLREGEKSIAQQQIPVDAMAYVRGLDVDTEFSETGTEKLDALKDEIKPLQDKIDAGIELSPEEKSEMSRIVDEINSIGQEEFDLKYGDQDRKEKLQLYQNVSQIVKDNAIFHAQNVILYNELSKGIWGENGKSLTLADFDLDDNNNFVQSAWEFIKDWRPTILPDVTSISDFFGGGASSGSGVGEDGKTVSSESGLTKQLFSSDIITPISTGFKNMQDWTQKNVLDLAQSYYSVGARPVNINVDGMTVREEADIDKIAAAFVEKIRTFLPITLFS